MKLEDFIDQVNPGVRKAIEFLWEKGYRTTDSGDGTNYRDGMEGAFPYDHVVVQCLKPQDVFYLGRTLQEELDKQGANALHVEATYFPRDAVSVILVSDPDETGQLRTLGQAKAE